MSITDVDQWSNPSPAKVYVAGPMRGIPDFNFPEFDRASRWLRKQGFIVINPADLDRLSGDNQETFNALDEAGQREFSKTVIQRDIDAIKECDAIALLPGWRESKGANVEWKLAEFLGLEILHLVPCSPGDEYMLLTGLTTADQREAMLPLEVPSTIHNLTEGPWVIHRGLLLPEDSQARKDVPLARGCLDYFPAALAEVARLSKAGNDKHNPGEDLHWARGKSNDHADCIMRHLAERGVTDTDGFSHSVKVAWRALALLQEELEAAGAPMARGAR